MPVKTIVHPVSGRTFKLGRKAPIGLPMLRRARFADYARDSYLPTAPPAYDWSDKASASLGNVYVNDRLGCCTIAAMAHIVGVLTSFSPGGPVVFTDAQIKALYSEIGGYVDGDESTDNGCDVHAVLDHWLSRGAPDGVNEIAGALALDPSNPAQYKLAGWLFENLYVGAALPDAWINPMPAGSGFRWDAAGNADPENGHAFMSYGATPDGVAIDTWALKGLMTDRAVAEYCAPKNGGELYCVVSREAIVKGTLKAPNALDWDQLAADFKLLGGSVKDA